MSMKITLYKTCVIAEMDDGLTCCQNSEITPNSTIYIGRYFITFFVHKFRSEGGDRVSQSDKTFFEPP